MTAAPRPRVGDQRVQQRIEWGVQWRVVEETVVPCADENAARFALVVYRRTGYPDATLVSRVVEVHPWRAAS